MKLPSTYLRRSTAAPLLLVAGLFLAGCQHQFYADPYSTKPVRAPGFDLTKPTPQPSPSVAAPAVASPTFVSPPVASSGDPVAVPPVALVPVPVPVAPVPIPVPPFMPTPAGLFTNNASVIQVSDQLTVTFSDVPGNIMPEFKERVREDGNITLPLSITLKAAGKTPGQLQQEIHDAYVPRYFVRLTPTVKTEDRFFFVGGEVKNPSRLPYFAQITVLRAIQAAGDFTDFAHRKKVQLIRANGQKHNINCIEALKKPEKDMQVFPGDTITVPRRIGIFGL
jgi:polysaccharide export outer membrane protein